MLHLWLDVNSFDELQIVTITQISIKLLKNVSGLLLGESEISFNSSENNLYSFLRRLLNEACGQSVST